MRGIPPLAVFSALMLSAVTAAEAQEKVPDQPSPKIGGPYTLFNPTPREQMRELNTDRPDVTESPITVDAGHVQLETSFFEYHADRHAAGSTEQRTWTFGNSNLKFGLLENVDLQLVFTPYTLAIMRDEATASRSTARGFSDMQVRTKINFWGNDGKSDTALGLMPFIQLPTGSDSLSSDHVEGGIIVPFAMKLTDNIDLSAMADWNFVYDPADRGYDTEFVHTVSLGFAFTEELGAYIEYVGIASTDGDSGYQALASTGVVYKITRDLQVDAGVQIGLTRAAEDLVVFSGFSVRF